MRTPGLEHAASRDLGRSHPPRIARVRDPEGGDAIPLRGSRRHAPGSKAGVESRTGSEGGKALDPLVSTKLRPSQSRLRLVARPRLADRLNPETGRKLALVAAPAGFGKTTLVGNWAEDRASGGHRVAWLSLDEGDNDPTRFLSYLVAALRRTVEEGFGEGILAALRSPEPPRPEALLAALINEFADLPGGLDLVLDDYHLIDSEPVHGIVSFMLERLPESVHLVVSCRVQPPLPLARL